MPVLMRMNLRKIGVLCGIVGPILWLLLIIVAGTMRPEFSHVAQYISELGERGSSTEYMMRYAAFGLTGLLYLSFATALLAIFRGGRLSAVAAALIGLDGLGRIGAGVFACDLGCEGLSTNQELHRLFATIGFLSGVLAAVVWGITFKQYRFLQRYANYSIWSGILALVFLLLMSWSSNPVNAPGLFEHLATGLLSLWILVFATTLIRTPEQHLERSTLEHGNFG